MSEEKFKTLRHMETVRNYINVIIRELLDRQEQHDQSKLEYPEVEFIERYTHKLRNSVYGSPEYKNTLRDMSVAINHHHNNNRHHPEYFKNGILDMNLIDLIELICDWKAATLRHDNGDIFESIKINQERFKYTDELATILKNTAEFFDSQIVFNKANES